ncbi:MAG: efflux RND transporter permease subunit [Candidatus Riflebacteria bacterium]|nr:efflux RND transporter permease subunit [Candidatus Riflebacteria bacterium]
MNIVELAVKRPVMMTMVLAFFVVMGLFSYGKIPVDMLPKIDFPMITVTTIYPGASPNNIETLVSKPIEDAVSSINGIDELKSDSYEGISNVLIKFEDNVDVNEAASDVRDKVSAARSELPDDVKDPIILKLDINALPILSLAVSGNRPVESIYQIIKDLIKDEILKVDGVADVAFIGSREREIRIMVNQDILKAFRLSPLTLAAIIGQKSLNIPSGHITQTRKEYSIRMDGEFTSVEEIRNLPVPVSNTKTIRLKEIASVIDDFEEFRQGARLNSKPTVAIIVKKRSDANSVRTSDGVLKCIELLEKKLPTDISITAIRNRATFITNSVNDLNGNIITGIIITAIILFMFLHSIKATLVSVISIPISIISSYTFLYFFRFSLNMMTQMALAISVGVLVNNAIVVLENIFVKLQQKKSPEEASIIGTNEILVAVSGCTLTNVVVFTPIAFMTGMIGRFFYEFGLTVTVATFVSLLAAFTLTPMCAALFMKESDAHSDDKNWFARQWDKMYNTLCDDYAISLKYVLNNKIITIIISAIIMFSPFLLASNVGFEFVTEPDQKEFDISIKMPPGSSLDNTDAAIKEIEKIIEKENDVKFMFAKLGKTESVIGGTSEGTNIGEVSVKLKPETTLKTDAFISKITEQVSRIPEVEVNMRKTGIMGTVESPLIIHLTGDSLEKLQEIEKKVLKIVKEVPGTLDVQSTWQSGKPEVKIIPIREHLAKYGMTEAFLAGTLRTYYEGNIAAKFREGDDEYDIRLKLSENHRKDVRNISSLVILTPTGAAVPLIQLAKIEETGGPVQINRKSRTRLITISANVAGRSLGEVLREIRAQTDLIDLPAGYEIYFSGAAERMSESFESLLTSLFLALIFTYMLLAALLESFIHPITILLTFPMAFGGIILGLFLTGQTLSIFSLMAVVMLVGIVVNNGILMIEEYRRLSSEGLSCIDSVISGSKAKLRPIIMTTIATVAAMVPLAMGTGSGGEMNAAMATVEIGGLIVSGVLSLFLIPLTYLIVETKLLNKT